MFTKKKRLIKSVQTLKPSATLIINEASKALQEEGKTIYKLGFGQSPFPVPEEIVIALQKNAFQKDYLPVKGLLPLRETLATYFQKKEGLSCSTEDVMIGPGSKELLFILQLAFDGDLLLPSPSWVSYEPQAALVGKRPIIIPAGKDSNWCITAEALETACQQNPERAKYLILNYPNNPTGISYTEENLKEIAAVARKYEVLIVADEIYGELQHDGQHKSLARYYPEGTIISTGLSKWCGAGGWRLGAFIFPEGYRWLLDGMAAVASETFSAVSAPVQFAAVTAYQGSPAIEEYIEHSRKILQAIAKYTHKELVEMKVNVQLADGGFYMMPDFENFREQFAAKGIFTGEEMCQNLLKETGVAMLPGSEFGRPKEELNARLCFVDFDGGQLLKKVTQISTKLEESFVLENCPKIVAAMQQIKTWLQP